MEKFLQAFAIAWNPVGQVRRRLIEGQLKFESVLIPFITAIIACNLFATAAQQHYWDSLFSASGVQVSHLPWMNDFAQRFFSAAGYLIPIAVVALLPKSVFGSHGRTAVTASMLVVGAAWAFYGAVISAFVSVTSTMFIFGDAQEAVKTFLEISLAGAIVCGCLVIGFWLRISRCILQLSVSRVFQVTSAAIAAQLVLFILSMWAVSNYMSKVGQ
jgi:hypothetical protein